MPRRDPEYRQFDADDDRPAARPRSIDPHRITTHPIRRSILAIFDVERDLEVSAVDLYRRPDLWIGGMPAASNVNYHCSILESAGLLREVRREQVRGAVKRTLGLTENGRAYLDGQGGILAANIVLDRMAAIIAEVKPGQKEDAYDKLAGLVESTGRDIGGAA
jgi:hypothetical protein